MANTQINEMDKLQRTDHDTLIRLEGKVDALIANVATLQSGSDMRLKLVEEKAERSEQWIHDFKHTYKVMGALAAGVSSVITFLLTVIALRTEIFK